jgi:mRNA interferase RelE/StbE
MYHVVTTKKFKKDLKKLSYETQVFIRHNALPVILNNPQIGGRLKGKNYTGLLKFKLKFKSVDYRIIYGIKNNELLVLLIMLAPRENIYKKLKQRIK